MFKNITIGILLLAIVVSGTLWYRQVQQRKAMEREIEQIEAETGEPGGHWHGDEWHAEPHPEHTGPATPLVEVEDVAAESLVPEQPVVKARERPPAWMHEDGVIPPEDAPRPFKHLTYEELIDVDADALSDEDWVYYKNERFFRMPKEVRDNHRRSIAEEKKLEEFLKRYYEQFPEARRHLDP